MRPLSQSPLAVCSWHPVLLGVCFAEEELELTPNDVILAEFPDAGLIETHLSLVPGSRVSLD